MNTATAEGRAHGRYKALSTERDSYLVRGRRLARLTIPALLPEEGSTGNDLPKPWQGMGARGVNHLSSRLLLSLFPVNVNFWRLKIDESVYLENPDAEASRSEHEAEAAQIEKAITDDIEVSGMRVKGYEAIRQLLVVGNSLVHLPFHGKPRVFRLDSYVVDRDPSGNLIEVVTCQKVSPVLIKPELREYLGVELGDHFGAGVTNRVSPDEKAVTVYTHCELTDNGWTEYQEINGKTVPESFIEHGEQLPYLALRYIAEDGSNYGRGLCEEYEGDLQLLEALSKAISNAALASSRLIGIADPGGQTSVKKLNDAPDGNFIMGRVRDGKAVDLAFLQVNKFADLQVAQAQIGVVERRLANVFLINTPRDAERVTAEEIRVIAQELESSLGGTFSLLSQEFQLPLVQIFLERARARGEVVDLEGIARPAIVTGLDAIGRGFDVQRLQTFVGIISQIPEAAARIRWSSFNIQIATALGVETEELIISEEEFQQMQQQAQGAELVNRVAPEVVKGYPQAVEQAVTSMAG